MNSLDPAEPVGAVADDELGPGPAASGRETTLMRTGLGVLGVSAVLLLIALPGTSNAVMMAALVSAVIAGTLLAFAAVVRAQTDTDDR